MGTLKLTIAYDGTRYAGWQVQKRHCRAPSRPALRGRLDGDRSGGQIHGKPTVQGTLEDVLSLVLRERVRVVGSGRTDAGVHAIAQIAHVTAMSTLDHGRLLRSLNQLLPHDIAVSRIQPANGAFHARFDAVRKRYRYRLFTGLVVPPFVRPYVHHLRGALDLALMRREAAALVGRHDFRVFAHAGHRMEKTSRRIMSVRLLRRSGEMWMEFEGSGFLHMMVRSIAGTLVDIGRGRLSAGTVRRMLRTGDRRLAGKTLPAKGLTLVSVTY